MNTAPLVSVLITVFNDELHIEQAVRSILDQTFQDFEIIIVNDGSTDQTASILQQLADKDRRIRIVDQPNMGTAAAANKGLENCTGKYIARLDSDDMSYPNRLKTEVDFLEAHPEIGLVGGGCHISDNTGRIIGVRNIKTRNPFKTLQRRCIYQQSDVMFRRSILDKIASPIYRDKLKAEDYDLWLRISEVTKIAKLNEVLGVWKLNGGGYTLSRENEQIEAVKWIKKMAALRRAGQEDGYEQFIPRAKTIPHRTGIRKYEYDKKVAQVLLKELRTVDARNQLNNYRQDKEAWPAVKKWYYLSFLPRPLLRLAFTAREYLLNHYSIELR